MKNKFSKLLVCFFGTFLFLHLNLQAQSTIQYDIVLIGGRVIDPETKLDAIRNVGIINNRISQISIEPLKGKQEINVSGLVVAPGFIDLHTWQNNSKKGKNLLKRSLLQMTFCKFSGTTQPGMHHP